jgi:hypothetical protein
LATPVAHVDMLDTAERLAALRLVDDDFAAAGKVAAYTMAEADAFAVRVTFE